MLIAITGFLFVTFLFSCVGICIAKEVKGRQKVLVWLLTFASWASIVAYATNLAGFWGKPHDTSASVPDWFMTTFCVLFVTAPLTIPLTMGIHQIWREGGKSSELPPLFFDEETSIIILYVVSFGLSFYLTDRIGIHNGWSFPISLLVLAILALILASFVGSVCWLATKLARRFSPAGKRAKTLESE